MQKHTAITALFIILTLIFGSSTLWAKGVTATASATEMSPAISKVNINSADAQVLSSLKGVGPKTADLIVDYRRKVGDFKTVEDIMNIRGIGEKTFESIKPFITVK